MSGLSDEARRLAAERDAARAEVARLTRRVSELEAAVADHKVDLADAARDLDSPFRRSRIAVDRRLWALLDGAVTESSTPGRDYAKRLGRGKIPYAEEMVNFETGRRTSGDDR